MSTDFWSCFVNIGHDSEESTIEVPPPLKKKNGWGLEKRIGYVYPCARDFLAGLVTVGTKFPELGMVKIEA